MKYWRWIELHFSSLMTAHLWKGGKNPSLRWRGRKCTITGLNLNPVFETVPWGVAGLCPYPPSWDGLFSDCLMENTCEKVPPEEPNYNVLSQSWELWCKRVVSVHTWNFSPTVTAAVAADRKWRMFRIHSFSSLEICVLLHFYIVVYAWIKDTLSLIYFVEQMCKANGFCLVFFTCPSYPHTM